MVGYRKSHCFKISWNCWGMTPKLWNLGWMGFWDGTGVCQETCGLPTPHYAHSLMDASSPSQGAVCSSMRCKALLSILTCGDLVLLCILVHAKLCYVMLYKTIHTSMQSYALSCYTRLCCVIHYLCNVMPNAKYHTLRKTLFCCALYTMPYALFTCAMNYALYPMRSALCTVR